MVDALNAYPGSNVKADLHHFFIGDAYLTDDVKFPIIQPGNGHFFCSHEKGGQDESMG